MPAASHLTEEGFTLPAHAKVNLTLRVLGLRADGYHEIRTVFQTITLRDRLTFEPLRGDELELICVGAESAPAGDGNLVLRAANALRERYGVRRGARLTLEKVIPIGGGLGGGSSDAAVTLLGLSILWGVGTNIRELAAIGAGLGADVPFFLTGGTALGTGRGTEIRPLEDAPKRELVVLTPTARVSTAEAYRALGAPALTKVGGVANLSSSRAAAQTPDSLYEVLSNDFEPVVLRQYPEIERARSALLRAGARRALLSGSGSSVFGVFDSAHDAARAAGVLRAAGSGWQLFPCVTLARDEYREGFSRCAALFSDPLPA